jgi:hypothetical protein
MPETTKYWVNYFKNCFLIINPLHICFFIIHNWLITSIPESPQISPDWITCSLGANLLVIFVIC